MWMLLGQLGVGIVIAGVSAYVTVRLALGRFRDEQWWSRRVDAYTAIIEAIYKMKQCDEAYMREYVHRREMSEKSREEVSRKSIDAYNEIKKAVDTGGFLLSDGAVAVLDEMQKSIAEVNNGEDYFSYLETSIEAAETCLGKLPQIAKDHLAVK